MCDNREFISGEHLTEADVDAYDRGELVEWRRGIDGVQWYRRVMPAAEPTRTFPDIYSSEGSDDEL